MVVGIFQETVITLSLAPHETQSLSTAEKSGRWPARRVLNLKNPEALNPTF